MATGGLYGSTSTGTVAPQSGSESVGLYGNNTVFGGSYFEYFIFLDSATAPATPTGGSWSFVTNVGAPPAGWSNTPPASPTNKVWISIALVNSKSTATLTWSAPGVFVALVGTVTNVSALTLGTTGTDVSSTVANSTTTPVITLNLPTASATNRGALSAADWTTFNNKGTGSVTSVSGTAGRVTSTGGVTPVIDLASGIATPGTTGSATLVPVVTIDTYGRVTSITTAANPQGTVTSVTGTAPVVSSGGTTPAISMAAATASVNGYLTSTDWTTFNSKGSGSVTSVAATVPSFLSVAGSPITTSGTLALTYSGTALPVANGGTGVTASSGANSVVLRDASVNISVNSISEGYSNVAAAGTTTTLTVASVPNYVVTGSGGQTYQLPDATTLANGVNYTFNNNQSSGTIVVKNNSSTTIATIQSGGLVDVSLLSNATAAGSWDVHNLAPSNVSWSTNTFDYPGSITSATWNGVAVAVNRGGTGLSAGTSGGVPYFSSTSTIASSAALAANALVIGGGAGVAPSTTTTGTGVVTALGVNTGSAGAFVVNGGALGTPSSGTLTNATGLPLTTGVTGTLPIANGGSGVTTAQAAMNTFAGAVTSGSYLRGNGTNVVMSTIQAADVPTLNQNTTGSAASATTATTATNIAGGTNFQIPYNTGSGATSFITAPTLSSTYLQYNGTGFVWAASAGLGTVTSVAATVPSFLSISGSPITTAGTLAISYSGTALPVANGGTGVTTSTGTGNVVLSTSPTIVTPTINTITSAAATALTLQTAGTAAVTVDTSQRVGIGTTSPGANLEVKGSSGQNIYVSYTSGSQLRLKSDSGDSGIGTTGSTPLLFLINNSEIGRIDTSGNVFVAQTSQTSTEKFGVTQSATGSNAARFYASSTSYVNNIVEISCARSGASTEYNAFCVFDNNTTLKMLIRPNGNLLNSNNSYGSLSDVSLKENIVDATPKLDNLMQVKIRNYNLKDDVTKTKQIGVIAQELETVFPGMIETDGDGIKAVKYSVFVPMLLKAIQEQQALIISLTARIAALEVK